MLKQHQTNIDPSQGNCWATCFACLLHMHPDDVPNFILEDDWWDGTRRWLQATTGFDIVEMNLGEDLSEERLAYLFDGYWIASGKSPRGDWDHSVIYHKGILAHDPHPDSTGLDGGPRVGAVFSASDPMVFLIN